VNLFAKVYGEYGRIIKIKQRDMKIYMNVNLWKDSESKEDLETYA
jgi:hypothetical protein